jgi:hypothetical protein
MKRLLQDRPVAHERIPLYNRFYLHASKASQVDPTMAWGTEIDAERLQAFLRERNRKGRIILTTAHALIRATGLALAQFPEMNTRVVGRRVYAFSDIGIRMAFVHRRNNEIDVLLVSSAHTKSLEQIGAEVWQRLLQAGRGQGPRDRDLARLRRLPPFLFRQLLRVSSFLDRNLRLPAGGRIDELRGGAAMVNDLSFAGAPPMRSYKPTRFPSPSDTLNLTLGPAETKVVARADGLAATQVMPLFVRADHRLVDAYQLGRFVAALRDLMNHPERLDEGAGPAIAAPGQAVPSAAGPK